MTQVFLGPKNHIGKNQGAGVNNRFFKSKNPGVHGDFNTYKFENRFTFKMIGDTERFANSQSIHDNFISFILCWMFAFSFMSISDTNSCLEVRCAIIPY